jgi:glucose-6-phosphate 1-dehydrogenase
MFKLIKGEAGHSLIKLLILSALTSIFLSALGSFATAIKLANSSLSIKKHSATIKQIIEKFHQTEEDKKCNASKLQENLEIVHCQSKDSINFSSIRERYEEE